MLMTWCCTSLYITSEKDWDEFQSDISMWTEKNHNISKCKCMLLTRKSLMMPQLYLSDQLIEQDNSYKYLGVLLTSDLRWNSHIDKICMRSKRLLGTLYRKFYHLTSGAFLCQLYISLVRPILEYASIVWDPNSQILIKQIESVQKFALRICSHEWNLYHTLLHSFGLPPLSSRRDYLRLYIQDYISTFLHLFLLQPMFPVLLAIQHLIQIYMWYHLLGPLLSCCIYS